MPGQKVDERSDVYSLGILAYEMTTGSLPYGGSNIMTVMAAHCDPDRRPDPLSSKVPDLRKVDELNAVIQKTMETEPAKRFQSVAETRAAIAAWWNDVQSELLSSLVSGRELNLAPETKHAVLEQSTKSSGGPKSSMIHGSDNGKQERDGIAASNDGTSENASSNTARPSQEGEWLGSAPLPVSLSNHHGQPGTGDNRDEKQKPSRAHDRARIEDVDIIDQKSMLRTTFNISRQARAPNRGSKTAILIAAIILAVLALAVLILRGPLSQWSF